MLAANKYCAQCGAHVPGVYSNLLLNIGKVEGPSVTQPARVFVADGAEIGVLCGACHPIDAAWRLLHWIAAEMIATGDA